MSRRIWFNALLSGTRAIDCHLLETRQCRDTIPTWVREIQVQVLLPPFTTHGEWMSNKITKLELVLPSLEEFKDPEHSWLACQQWLPTEATAIRNSCCQWSLVTLLSSVFYEIQKSSTPTKHPSNIHQALLMATAITQIVRLINEK